MTGEPRMTAERLLEESRGLNKVLTFQKAHWRKRAIAAEAELVVVRERAEPLPADTVCACLHETGERKVRIYERCERCYALMESDLGERAGRLEQALRVYADPASWGNGESAWRGEGKGPALARAVLVEQEKQQ